MAFADAMMEIEHLKFAVRVGLANSFRAFLRNISDEPSVKELLVLAKSRDVGLLISERVNALSKLRVDFRFLHRFDVPIATYLWVLSRSHPDLARMAAEASANLPRTWWTEQVANYILQEWSQQSPTLTNVSVITGNAANSTTSNVASGTAVFLSGSPPDFAPTKERPQVRSETNETSTVTEQAGTDAALAYTTGSSPKLPAESK